MFSVNYGSVRIEGKLIGAHVAFFRRFVGPIPPGMCVCHTCDTPLCVNPAHLFLGTKRDNMQDCLRKGRKPGLPGEENGAHILTEEQVLAIFVDGRTQGRIAESYGVDRTTVNVIKTGKKWGWLTGPSGLKAHRLPLGPPRRPRTPS